MLLGLSELARDERDNVLDVLAKVIPRARHEGYEDWEMSEQLQGTATSLGVMLSAADKAAIVAQAGEHR